MFWNSATEFKIQASSSVCRGRRSGRPVSLFLVRFLFLFVFLAKQVGLLQFAGRDQGRNEAASRHFFFLTFRRFRFYLVSGTLSPQIWFSKLLWPRSVSDACWYWPWSGWLPASFLVSWAKPLACCYSYQVVLL